jgi:hypothetical protein
MSTVLHYVFFALIIAWAVSSLILICWWLGHAIHHRVERRRERRLLEQYQRGELTWEQIEYRLPPRW